VTGEFRHILQPIRVSRSFGQRISHTYSELLKCNLKTPLIVIDIHVSNEHITVGVPLSGLASPVLGGPSHGLRSTTASAMTSCLGSLEPGTIILDPMCGKGSLLYELPPHCLKIGVDIDRLQLFKAKKNVEDSVCILGDVTKLPLQSNSVQHIICDLPFGISFSTPTELNTLLPQAIAEMKRVIKQPGKIVLLTSLQQDSFVSNCVGTDWSLKCKFPICLGTLEAVIHVYISTIE
jgi:23S rRNA G2445 N2-methylase RlmL